LLLVPGPGELVALDLARLGPPLEAARPGGQNIEWIAPRPDGGLMLRVWERGVGETAACGTGSVAAAAARAWGVVGERLTVWNPGGPLEVALERAGARLIGDAHYVGRLEPGHDLWSLLGGAQTVRVGGRA
jgi:diaminopimelate epimerase